MEREDVGGSPERMEFRCMAIVFNDRMDLMACGDGEFCKMLCDFSTSSKDCERECHRECVSRIRVENQG